MRNKLKSEKSVVGKNEGGD
jgi:hypothetical protein